MKIPILDKDDSWIETVEKVEEEYEELEKEIINRIEGKKNDDEILEETFDVIQMCIGILEKLEEEGLDIEKASRIHLGKLVSRGWKFKEILQINKL